MKPSRNLLLICPFLVSVLCLTACTEYWWTRGQPPAVSTLYARAKSQLNLAHNENPYNRGPVIKISSQLQSSLSRALNSLHKGEISEKALSSSRQSFIEIERHLSMGSRPAYGELTGQFRVMTKDKEALSPLAFELFTARVYLFLASELSVPAPKAPRAS